MDHFGPHGGSVDIRRSGLGFVCTLFAPCGRWTVLTWAWAATPSGRISVRPDSGAQMKTSDIDGHDGHRKRGGHVGMNKIEIWVCLKMLG